jgi:hypothetical protein
MPVPFWSAALRRDAFGSSQSFSSSSAITLDIYGQVVPGMQDEVVTRIGQLMFG